MSLLEARGLARTFTTAAGALPVLRGVDLDVRAGEMIAVTGSSGAGKTTLLHLLGALDRAEAGTIRLGDARVERLAGTAAAAFRNRHIGFVFQHHRLLPEFTAVENVAFPLRIRRVPRGPAQARAAGLLASLGLEDRLTHRPEALSGGEQQRVAVARALVGDPSLLLADEPTGNLDDAAGERLADLLTSLHRSRGLTSIIATHSTRLAARCDRILRLRGGRLRAPLLNSEAAAR